MKKILKFPSLALILVIAQSGLVQAKDLTHRLGVGVRDNNAVGVSELFSTYHYTNDLSIVGGVGIDTNKDNSRFSANAALRKAVFRESNLNFYMGGKLGLVTIEVARDKNSGFELAALFGAEFFLPGLENLSLTFEGGLGVVSAKDVRFQTVGNTPFSAGVTFYF